LTTLPLTEQAKIGWIGFYLARALASDPSSVSTMKRDTLFSKAMPFAVETSKSVGSVDFDSSFLIYLWISSWS
jgi:hypothetical protein